MMGLLFANALPWLLIAVGTWLGYQLVRQNGRILLRLESIEKKLHRPAEAAKKKEATGLAIGSAAPDFELPDLSGKLRKLSEYRGRDVLLTFFNPQCGFCTQLAADLAALPIDGSNGRPIPVVITTGDADENRKLVEQFGMRCIVLLQEQMKVAAQYRVHGTPMGYRIDAAGLIASQLAAGADALLQLADRDGAPQQNELTGKANGSAHHGKQPDPSLAKSRLNRNGLKAGTIAPEFRLPRIDGGELTLNDFRGRQVLLVFSDPNCGPCDELAPWLQKLHLDRPDLRVLVVSRRDLEATRIKANELGLSYPIVMQKQWEISLKYAMFATPIGYLIDELGIIASDVAVGVKPMMALANESPPESADDFDPLPSETEPAFAN